MPRLTGVHFHSLFLRSFGNGRSSSFALFTIMSTPNLTDVARRVITFAFLTIAHECAYLQEKLLDQICCEENFELSIHLTF
jgi:hypothetical protein